jgi:very-short-patch-repair endonuclease
MRRRLLGDRHLDVADGESHLGELLRTKGDFRAGEPHLRRALALHRELLGAEHVTVANDLHELATALMDGGDYAGGEPLYDEALAMRRKLLGPAHPDVAESLNGLSYVMTMRGDLAAAERFQTEALAIYRKAYGDAHPLLALTLSSLAATLDRRGIERLLDRAELQRLGDVLSLDALARAHTGHPGAHKLLRILHHHDPGTTLTKSELEEAFYALCQRAGLPKPAKVNDHVEAFEADFIFKNQRVLVETDSWQHHRSRESFEQDRRRDAIHAAAGWRTLRFTHRQIEYEPATVAAAIEAALRYRGASAASSVA